MKRTKKSPQDKIEIKARNLTSGRVFSLRSLEDFAKKVLKAQEIPAARISIILVAAPFMRSLNKKYLSKDRFTDVLSFDLRSPAGRSACLFGDVVVSVDAADKASKTHGVPFRQEVCRYIIHGILHLVGFDDGTQAARKKMWKRQEELLNDLLNARLRP